MTPTLVLTRPEAQSREVAAALGDGVAVIVSPVMKIVAADKVADFSRFAGVVLTSANAVACAPDLDGMPAWCVGKRTAEAAHAAGAEVRLVAQDANDLVARFNGAGPLLHLRGEHARGDIATRLSSAGIETSEAVIYRQKVLSLSTEAKAALKGGAPVVLPLYSPRSAELVGQQLGSIGAEVHTIAMSDAVRDAWYGATGAQAEVVSSPTGQKMLEAIRRRLGL